MTLHLNEYWNKINFNFIKDELKFSDVKFFERNFL